MYNSPVARYTFVYHQPLGAVSHQPFGAVSPLRLRPFLPQLLKKLDKTFCAASPIPPCPPKQGGFVYPQAFPDKREVIRKETSSTASGPPVSLRLWSGEIRYANSDGSDSPPDCHSIPRRRFAVSLRLGHARGKTTLSCFLTLSRRYTTFRYPVGNLIHRKRSPRLAAALVRGDSLRELHGSDSPPDCHSTPRRRFATQ